MMSGKDGNVKLDCGLIIINYNSLEKYRRKVIISSFFYI